MSQLYQACLFESSVILSPKHNDWHLLICWRLYIFYKPLCSNSHQVSIHNGVIKWTHFPRYWPVRRSFDVFFDLCLKEAAGWTMNTPDELRRHRTQYDVIVMLIRTTVWGRRDDKSLWFSHFFITRSPYATKTGFRELRIIMCHIWQFL